MIDGKAWNRFKQWRKKDKFNWRLMSWKSRTITIFIVITLVSTVFCCFNETLAFPVLASFVAVLFGKREPEGAVFPSILKLENRK